MRRFLAALFLSFVSLTVFAQSADQAIVSVTESADPVIPGQNYTYTIQLQNNGPNAATNGGVNIVLDGNIEAQSTSVPAGWSCTSPGQFMSCTKPSFGSGETATIILTARVAAHRISFPDGSVTANFSTSGVTSDPNSANNAASVTTSWDSPQMDISVAVTDSPDPVGPDGDITYSIAVTNAGPDAATAANFNVFQNNTLRFRSATAPAGWNCTLPPVDGNPTMTCSTPTFAPSTVNFTVVLRAYQAVVGNNDGTVSTVFSANGTGDDTNDNNNMEQEDTAYVTPDADMAVSATDSPDPVAPDGNITYTVQVNNNGPDTAPNATMSMYNNGTLQFQSLSAPAGWNCAAPAVGATPTFTCTNPSLPSGGSATFTVVVHAEQDILGINDGTVSVVFTAGSSIADPNNGNNIEQEDTVYATADANLAITATDSPDPVVNGSNLTYQVTATNAGPDPGTNTQVALAPHPSLTFQSVSAPAGWSCTTPAVDAAGATICTLASFPSGGTANFTLVTKLVTSGSGGTLNSVFTISANVQDPVPANNSVEVFTNWVGQTSDLAISKNTLSTAAAQGSTITYNLSTTNNGPDAASNVTVTDILQPALRFQSITAPAGWNCTTPAVGTNGTVTCTVASLANGATANFTLVVSVAPNATGTISNSATVGSGSTDPTPGNSSGSSGSVVVAGNADLGVTKTTAATTATPGNTISYTINVSNAGPDPAASVVMTDILPASLLFQSIAAPAGWTCTTPAVGANGTVTCNAATLASGATATFTLVATVANNASGTITNSASAAHSGTDGNPGNSSGAAAPTPVVAPSADLAINKNTNTTSVAPGATFSYTIAVTNNGPDAAANVVMTDILPAQLQFVSITTPAGFNCVTPAVNANGTVTCTAATLANGATANFTLTVRVSPSATSGSVTNSATVVSTTADSTPANGTDPAPAVAIAAPTADLAVTKTTASSTLTTGNSVTYTITVTNNGPSAATNVIVTDDLPAGLTFVSATPSQGTCNASDPISCNVGTLNNGASATISVVANVTATSGTIANTASADGTETDPVGGNNSSTTPAIPVVPGAAEAEPIPTLGEWALIAFAALLGLAAVVRMKM